MADEKKKKRGRRKKQEKEIVPAVVDEILDLKLKDINDEIKDVPIEQLKANLTYNIKTETPLSLLDRYVAEMKMKGYSPLRIANELGVPEAVVKRTLNSKAVKEYIQQITAEVKETIKSEMIALMRRTIEDKVRYIEEKYDGDFSKATRKDLPELLKMLDDMMKEEEKAKLGTTQNVFVNILNQVTD